MKMTDIVIAYGLCVIAIIVSTFAVLIGLELSGVEPIVWVKCAKWYCIVDGVLTFILAVFYIVTLIITQVKHKNKEV